MSSQRLVLPIYRTPKQNILQNLQKVNNLSPIYRGISGQNVKPFFNYQAQNYKSQQQEKENNVADESKNYSSGDNFAFSYTVKDHETGDDFSHSQQSSGSSTNGEYRVRLPDGRMQIVSYTADENGYKANVRYDEENEVNTGVKLDLKALNKFKEEIPNERYIEHRVDEIKRDHSPQYNKFAYSNAKKDNIYFDYVDKTATLKHHADTNDYIFTDTNDYLDQVNDKVGHIDKILHEYKGNENHDIKRNHDDYYQDEDTSPIKEYKDYSEEAEGDYSPHKSKYATFVQNKDIEFKPTVKPTYEELKKYFVSTLFPQNVLVSSTEMPSYDSSLINSQFVSSTLRPHVERTTERVVTIGSNQPRLFTNIRNILGPSSVAPDSFNYATSASPVTATPSSYLYSTITNLKNKISISRKPQLSAKYIDKINKYLSFK